MVSARSILPGLALCVLVTACSQAPPRPDIVVVLLDTVRPDHLGCYGADPDPAPFLASVARGGLVFREAISTSSWTAPATTSLHTGLYPPQHGVVEGLMAHRSRVQSLGGAGADTISISHVAADTPLLAERLHELGYRTWGIGTNPNFNAEFGLHRGFDRVSRLKAVRLDNSGRPAPGKRGTYATAPAAKVLDLLQSWVEEDGNTSPRFVYLHLNDAHRPYHYRAPWCDEAHALSEHSPKAYDSEIHYMDSVLEKIWKTLDVGDDDLVIVVSDHGEGFGDHNIESHEWGLYRAVNRIVMMVRGPELGLRRGYTDLPVSLVDIVPTILDMENQPATNLPGRSLLPILQASATADTMDFVDRTLYAHRLRQGRHPREAWLTQESGWKLILEGDQVKLYHIDEDPLELDNLATKRPEITDRLTKKCMDFRRWPRADSAPTALALDPKQLETLRSLGYVD